jgi:hypothetical protein
MMSIPNRTTPLIMSRERMRSEDFNGVNDFSDEVIFACFEGEYSFSIA